MPRLDLRIKSIDTGTCVISSNSRGLNYFYGDEKFFCAGFYSDDGVGCWTRLNYTDLTVRASGSPTTVL